jgi:2-methylcitrate dehydratase
MTIARELSEYSHSLRFKDLDRSTVLEAKKRLLDSLGCALGAFGERPIRAARGVTLQNYPLGECAILGTKLKTTADMATFVNGAMTRYFDFNDTYLSREPAHPSDNIAACLAITQKKELSGSDFLVGMILAYEIQCRLCDAASIRSRGWDHVCYGLVSSALASGRLLGLGVEQLENAVNISLNSHIAMRQVRAGELSDWKGFSFANASRNAVFSALLAQAKITGPAPIFEGEMGFFHQVSGEFQLDIEEFGRRQKSFKLMETYIKFYPAEYHAQTAIWAALEIRKQIKKADEIQSVEIQTHEAGYTILGKDKEKWAPKTKETADHSLPFMVGAALLYGKVDNASYSPRRLADPELLRLLKKISVREDPELTRDYPRKIANRIRVKLSGGQVITRQVDTPKGHPNNPMSQQEVEEKFKRLTRTILKEGQIERIFEYVWNIEAQEEISQLFTLCASS